MFWHFRSVLHRSLYGPWEIVKDNPSARAQQHIDEYEAETGYVPSMSSIEITHIELWPRLRLDHLRQLPRIRAVCIDGCHPMCQIERRQNFLYVRIAFPCRVFINCNEVTASKVFENRRNISATLAVEKADLEDILCIVLDDSIAQELCLRVTHIFKLAK